MHGLSSAEASARLSRFGPNTLPAPARTPPWIRFGQQFASPLIYILLFALVLDLGLWIRDGRQGWPVEALAIGLILLLNALLGLYQEHRSEAALAKLTDLTAAHAWVLRDGRLVRLPSRVLVPGDRVRVEAGDRVPADGTLVDARSAMLDESMLTGESVPIEKGDGDEAFSGTLVARGRSYLDITRTGSASAMGRLASMLGEVQASATPLERQVDQLGRQIARWVLGIAVVLGALGIAAEGLARAPEMIVFSVALAVAAVPEGLPAVLTVALALGVERMARQQAVVRRLSAVEALGSVTVIATDKTGTVTEGRMDVHSLDVSDPSRALETIVLANDADLATGAGDPLDLGLLRYAATHGADVSALRRQAPIVSGRPFDCAWKFARVTVRDSGRTVSYLKGAPEVLIERCALAPDDRVRWKEKAEGYARRGFRMLALAWAEGEAEDGLSFLGLVAFWDPPRAEVPDAVRRAQAAGIRVIMITGDHPATAQAVAAQIGIPASRVLTGEDLVDPTRLGHSLGEVNVFARVQPEQKLRLVEALQAQGHIVAMTGDGVNDAPALKRSDVGVAMGRRGSDVSREVADLVLLDDNFATIVRAVEEGRGIYENVQKFLRFLFSTNLSEVLLVAGGALLAFTLDLRDPAGALLLPLTAAQILWINLMTDGLPALALAFDRTPGVVNQRPRPTDVPLLDRHAMQFILTAGSMKALLALGMVGLVVYGGYDLGVGRTVAFHFMAIGQLLLTYPSRHTWIRPTRNLYLHGAVALGIGVQLAAASLPASAALLNATDLGLTLWATVFGGALLAWGCAEAVSRFVWRQTGP